MRKHFLYILGAALIMSVPGYAQTFTLSTYLEAVEQRNNDLKLAEKRGKPRKRRQRTRVPTPCPRWVCPPDTPVI